MATAIVSFVLTTSTTAAFLPSLKLIYNRRRHFECFVGAGQLFSTLMFEASSSTGLRIFGISSDKYHHVSDILTETYVCLLLIHLLGIRDEDKLHLLRYR